MFPGSLSKLLRGIGGIGAGALFASALVAAPAGAATTTTTTPVVVPTCAITDYSGLVIELDSTHVKLDNLYLNLSVVGDLYSSKSFTLTAPASFSYSGKTTTYDSIAIPTGATNAAITWNQKIDFTLTIKKTDGKTALCTSTFTATSPDHAGGDASDATKKDGYYLINNIGVASSFGNVAAVGSPSSTQIVGGAKTVSGKGYWAVTPSGKVEAKGDAVSFGDMSGKALNAPIVGMAVTRTGGGYWLLGKDGGIFSFGDAKFYGSMGGKALNAPIVGMSSAQGGGYYFVGSDGGVFAFGPGTSFLGSMGGKRLNQPMVAIAAAPKGSGYWMVAADGGVFSYGPGSQFYGSMGSKHMNAPIIGMVPTTTGLGYRFVGADGGVFSFGDADFYGSLGGSGTSKVVAMF